MEGEVQGMQTQIAAMVVGAHIDELRREAAEARAARKVRKEARRSRRPLASLEALILARRARQAAANGAAYSPAPR
jgi:hypothetical protein